MQPTPTQSRYFEALEMVRGLAAIIVIVYHADFMFGLRYNLLTGGFLAVDVFFVLSGFVLSLKYTGSIRSGHLGFRQFVVARLARIYPLYFVTLLMGIVATTIRFKANHGFINVGPMLESAALNVLMLPSLNQSDGTEALFPFNGATWSIFFEMFISIMFFIALAKMSFKYLGLVCVIAYCALSAYTIKNGTADLGWGVSSVMAGLPRVFCSFTLGMLIHRLYTRMPWRCPVAVFYGLLLFALALVQLRGALPLEFRPALDLAFIGVISPAILAAGAGVALEGRQKSTARVLGETSYAVYLLQSVMVIVAAGATQLLLGQKIYDVGAWVGFVFVPSVLVIAYFTHRWFEAPVRRAIRSWSAAFLTRDVPEPALPLAYPVKPMPLDEPINARSEPSDPDHPRVPPNMRVYVIADVHGRADLLQPLLKRVDADMRETPGRTGVIVFLGDYIDRGPYSAEVLALLMLMQRYRNCVFLAGNHERMLLRFLDDPVANVYWLDNGGIETMRSYGLEISKSTDLEDLHKHADLLNERLGVHRDFLAGLQTNAVIGDYLFVHAGIRPGVPLPMQASDDLLTIREPFLSFNGNHGKRVVHGHTPVREPDMRPNRINLDCGAFATSKLVCLVLEDDRAWIF